MIRILHVFGKLNMGGAETMIMNVYRKIDKNKIQFDFVKHSNEKCEYEEEIIKMGGRIFAVPRYKLYNHFNYIKAWNNLIGEHKEWKIIHCHIRSTASIILKIAQKFGLKTICHSHSTSNGKGIKSLVKKMLQLKIPKYSDYLFACSQESAVWLYGKKMANSNRCIVINNAIDTTKYRYNKQIRKKIRSEFKLEGKIVLGQVGRMEYVKNQEFSLKLLKYILKSNKDYMLLLVGEGSMKKYIVEESKELGIENNVIFLKNRVDVNELMQAMDVYLMPSLWEGLSLALIEAQASCLPCIISDNITAGIIDCDLVKRLPLKADMKEWVDSINNKLKIERIDKSDLLKASKFDIETNVKYLEEFYLSLTGKEVKKCI